MNNILFLFLYFKCYFYTLDAIASHIQSFCKVLLRKVIIMYTTMAKEVNFFMTLLRVLANRVIKVG